MKRNIIEDKDLLGRLERCGFKYSDSPTYDDAINWFIEKKKIIITLTPAFGGKVDYDTFKLIGWFFELNILTNDGIFLMGDEFNKWVHSYMYTTKPGNQENSGPKVFQSRLEAIKEAVKYAVIFYIKLQSNRKKIWDGWRNKCILPNPKEWPPYLALRSDEAPWSYHSFYQYFEKNNYIMANTMGNIDPNPGKHINVRWDGQDYLIVESTCDYYIGKKLYPLTKEDITFYLKHGKN